jgi:hypothetical protein
MLRISVSTALEATAGVHSFAPAVGVTQTKEATMKTTKLPEIAALNDLCRKAMA